MGDLENFSVSEGQGGVDAGALDRLREQMKAAAAQMAKDQKDEKKQKDQEDTLYHILITFLNTLGPSDPLVALIVKCLAENIGSDIILVILSLNYKSLSKAIKLDLINSKEEVNKDEESLIVPKLGDQDLDISIKFNIDLWIHRLNEVAFEKPARNLQSLKLLGQRPMAKTAVVNLMAHIMQVYLQSTNQPFFGENVLKFCGLICSNLVERLEEHLKNTKLLEDAPK